MNALFIGRFQPFHIGHLNVIQNEIKKYDKIIIGIGSSQYKNTKENPFSSDERIKMIEESLNDSEINNYKIILIPDIHNPPKWVDHVLSVFSDFEVVISNSSFTKELFIEKNIEVIETELFEKDKFSGKEIRKNIAFGKSWEDCIPKCVEQIIKEIDGVKRIKELFGK